MYHVAPAFEGGVPPSAQTGDCNTRELHEKIESLQVRIKELETALAQLQSTFTTEPHPLLVKPHTTTTEHSQSNERISKDNEPEDEDLVDTFGSLTIGTEGETVCESSLSFQTPLILTFSQRKEAETNNKADLGLPIDIILLSRLFPFKNTILGVGNVANDQQVAVFFISMAIYVLGDPKHPMYHPDARRYYHLSRVSMSLGEELFSTFNIMIDDPDGPNRAWGALGLAIRLAQMSIDCRVATSDLISIDRDNEQWNKYPEQAERRRRIWWDLVLYETIYGFAMGRPRAIYPASVTFLSLNFSTDNSSSDITIQKCQRIARMKARHHHVSDYKLHATKWIAGCLGSVLDEAFAVKPPPYSSILNVPSLGHLMKGDDSEIGPEVLLRSLSTTGLREIAKQPYEPLSSKYAISVLAVHYSSTLLLHGISRSSHIVEQVCLSAIVIKSPGCSLAPSSLTEIDRIKDTLTGPTIVKLHEQAHLAMNKYNEGKWSRNASVDGPDADVMKFIGRTDFAPAKQQDVTVKIATENPFENEAHSMLFEYMKQFETQPEKPTGTPTSTPHFIPGNSIFSYDMPGLGNSIGSFDSHTANRPLRQIDIVNDLVPSSESATTTSQMSHSTRWPSSHQHNSPHTPTPIQGDSSNIPSQDFLFQDLLLDQGTGLGQANQQPSQDQIWEQFLSSLIYDELGNLYVPRHTLMSLASSSHIRATFSALICRDVLPATWTCGIDSYYRFILSNTRDLHEKIEALQNRIKELEAALAQLQSKSLKAATESLRSDDETTKYTESDDEDLVDTFGSLTIDPEGKSIQRNEDDPTSNTNTDPELPVDILLLSKLSPLKSVHEAEDVTRALIRSYLPPRDVAYDTSSAVWNEFRQMIFEPVYTPELKASDQQIALFFMSMALCMLSDPSQLVYHPNGRRYYHLSRASISLSE
ncbi:14636_t:CDS:10, partial [Acaulospora colombiana]